MKKIALFGGSFDPIHTDHISIIKACHYQLGFDEVWVIPTHLNPFKTQTNVFDQQRLDMIKLAISHLPFAKVDHYEIAKKNHNYTYQTVLHYQTQFPNYLFSFIIGSDQLDRLEEWDQFPDLIKRIEFLVFKRTIKINNSIINKYKLQVIDFPSVNLSSTKIRGGELLTKQLPLLNNYINHHLLYVRERLANFMDQTRAKHSINTGVLAAHLAWVYGTDINAALFAGVYHDIAKQMPESTQLLYIKKYWPDLINEPKPTWHGYAGYGFLKDEWGVEDENVLLAIKKHTTADVIMSVLDKIVFVADKVSYERVYHNVEDYRNLAYKNLNQCFVELLNNQIAVARAKHGNMSIGKQILLAFQKWGQRKG